jgi:hypothetical protein
LLDLDEESIQSCLWAFEFELSEEDFNEYLRGGRWSAGADDNIVGKTISGDFIQKLVLAYNRQPTSIRAHQGLGLAALLLGIAEWESSERACRMARRGR